TCSSTSTSSSGACVVPLPSTWSGSPASGCSSPSCGCTSSCCGCSVACAPAEFASPAAAALRLAPTRFARQPVGLLCGAPAQPDAPCSTVHPDLRVLSC